MAGLACALAMLLLPAAGLTLLIADVFWPMELKRCLRPRLYVFFSQKGKQMSTVNQISSNDPNGVDLTILETAKGAPVPLGAGPFTITILDPNNTVRQVAGTPDQKTPTSLVPNGTGNVGAVTVTVTDTANNLVSAPTVLNVVAPPPPAPDAIEVAFTPRSAPPA